MGFISDQLIQWHKTSGRHNLPWQNTDNPLSYLVVRDHAATDAS
jgi:adenine-specific DNA glycosylase